MAKKKNKNVVAKDFLKTLRARPENHILKKTNKEKVLSLKLPKLKKVES